MNTFLKILGIVFLFLLAMKFAPVLLAPLFIVAGMVVVVALACLAGIWATAIVMLAAITVLMPVWLPIALLVGFVMLICRLVRGPAAA